MTADLSTVEEQVETLIREAEGARSATAEVEEDLRAQEQCVGVCSLVEEIAANLRLQYGPPFRPTLSWRPTDCTVGLQT